MVHAEANVLLPLGMQPDLVKGPAIDHGISWMLYIPSKFSRACRRAGTLAQPTTVSYIAALVRSFRGLAAVLRPEPECWLHRGQCNTLRLPGGRFRSKTHQATTQAARTSTGQPNALSPTDLSPRDRQEGFELQNLIPFFGLRHILPAGWHHELEEGPLESSSLS